jgi:hypothetical protein
LRVVDAVFCWGFCENDCAERGFLRGKRGEVVVICVAKRDSKSAPKIRTGFSHKMRFILRGATRSCKLSEEVRSLKAE